RATKLIERGVEPRGIGSLDERCLCEHAQPDHRLRPGCRVVRAAACRAPQDGRGFAGQRSRERLLDSNEAVVDELFDLRGRQAVRTWCGVAHDTPHHTTRPDAALARERARIPDRSAASSAREPVTTGTQPRKTAEVKKNVMTSA